MSCWNYVLIFLVYYLLLRWKLVDTNPHTFGVESSYCQMRFRQAFGLGERDAYLDPKLKYLSRELLVCFLTPQGTRMRGGRSAVLVNREVFHSIDSIIEVNFPQ